MKYFEWPLNEEDITSELCAKCGMCCNWPLDISDKQERAIDFFEAVMEGREGIEKVGHGVYKLWCVHLKDHRCSIYEDRPQMCRDYNCVSWAQVDFSRGTPKERLIHYNKIEKMLKEEDDAGKRE